MSLSLSATLNKILKNRLTLVMSAFASVIFGLYFSELSKSFGFVSKLYISFLQLSIVPILMTSIMLSTCRLASAAKKTVSIQKSLLVFSLLLAIMCVFGVMLSVYGNFGGHISEKPEINTLLLNSGYSNALELTQDDPIEKQTKTTAWNFIVDIMPHNIVQALSNGYILQILTFSILFGLALGKIKEENQQPIVTLLKSLNAVFQKIIGWAVLLLPLGLFFIVSSQIALMSKDVILSMSYFLMTLLLAMLTLSFLITLIIWARSSCTYRQTLESLKETALISVVTSSSITALPALMKALENLSFNKETINLLTPLGITTCRYGTALYFAAIAVFIAQMYYVPLANGDFLIIIVGSILASLVSASTGVVNLKFMSFILDPLGIPSNLALVLFIAIDSLIDPVRTLLNVLLNGAAVVLSLPHEKERLLEKYHGRDERI